MRPAPIPDDEILPGSKRVVIGPPVGHDLTGDIRSEVVDRVAAHGISVLIKPFSTDELLQHMAQLYKGSPPGNPTSLAG